MLAGVGAGVGAGLGGSGVGDGVVGCGVGASVVPVGCGVVGVGVATTLPPKLPARASQLRARTNALLHGLIIAAICSQSAAVAASAAICV